MILEPLSNVDSTTIKEFRWVYISGWGILSKKKKMAAMRYHKTDSFCCILVFRDYKLQAKPATQTG